MQWHDSPVGAGEGVTLSLPRYTTHSEASAAPGAKTNLFVFKAIPTDTDVQFKTQNCL